MAIRSTQEAVETPSQGTPRNRLTQEAVEILNQPQSPAQHLRMTQIAIEFPFPTSSGGGGGGPPPPTQGDTPPPQCEPPPGQQCTNEPDLRAAVETCELLGS